MLRLSQEIYDRMVEHAKHDLPNECCGYLAGVGSDVTHIFPMTNVDHSPEHFSFDPKEQFKVLKSARHSGLELLSVYHSHPETPARLSQEDIRLLNDPNMIYIIVSMMEPKPDVKGFRIVKSKDDQDIKITQVQVSVRKE